ncbi:hypothetical protein HKCCE2091_13095 [Rhodobacterales bacterium HKCCE2091]|nr:hypothetical protein [Rhodobacterales bacterium HKCCE2091]
MQRRGFDWTIAPTPRAVFLSDYFETRPLVLTRNDPGYYAGLLDLETVDRVVTTMGLGPPDLTLAGETDHDAAAVAPGAPADPARVADAFARGATIVLSGLQNRLGPLGAFTRAMEADLSARVQTNAYLTPAGAQGFAPHYDSHDVLVLQIAGRKEWRIYGTPVELPLPSQGFSPGTDVGAETARFTLGPGDTAYIPRGLAHAAATVGEAPSLHITTGLMFRTWADLLAETVVQAAAADPTFRRALPPGFAADDTIRAGAESVFRDLLARLSAAPYAPAIDAFRADFVSNRLSRVEGQVLEAARLDALTPDSRIAARPDLIWDLAPAGPGEVRLICQGAELTFPDHAEPALRAALAADGTAVRDLPGDLDDDGKLVLARRLIREGLLRQV